MAIELTVTGMHCEHCEQTVVDALESVDGVSRASADHESDSAKIEGEATTASLIAAVDEAGYSATA